MQEIVHDNTMPPMPPQHEPEPAAPDDTAEGLAPVRLLLVEDNEDDVLLTRRAFRKSAPHITIEPALSGRDARRMAAERRYDLAVVDYSLPDMDGVEVLRALRRLGLPVLMVTGRGDERLAVRALKSGAEDYIVKDDGYLRRLLQASLGAVARDRLDRENRTLAAQSSRQAALLEAVLNTDPGAIVVLRGPQLRFELANPSFRALFSALQEHDPTGKPLLEVAESLQPDFAASDWHRLLTDVYLTGREVHLPEVAIPSASRGQRYFRLHVLPLDGDTMRAERGIVVILVETTEEVLALRRVQELAREAEAQRAWLQAVLDQIPEGIYIASAASGDVLFTNKTAVRIIGAPLDNVRADNVPEMLAVTYPDGSPIAVEDLPLQQAMWQGKTVTGFELRQARAHGEPIDILVSAAPLYDREGNVIAGVAIFQDITPLKEVERMKDEFVSIASHELRTPLTSVRATAQLMIRRAERGGYSEADLKPMQGIVQQSTRMARLIDELLDAARLQSGRIQMQPTLFDLSTLSQEVAADCRLSHPGFEVEVHGGEPVWVEADRDRIAQVIGNLLDNAVKYASESGRAGVFVSKDAREGTAVLQVRDNGVGFDPHMHEHIFERFSRLGDVANHSRGMGLGLYICREIVNSHGGSMQAESEGPGHGATFTVTLPLRES